MSDIPASEPSGRSPYDKVGWGALLAIGVHAVALPLLWPIVATASRDPYLPLLVVANFGWAQLLYMPIPILVLVRLEKRAMLKGLLIVAGVSFLITSTCMGILTFGS